ncbi:MAG: two-component regulator propeller domain-containing protein, partial [Bacteroidota bacterium]
RFFHDPDHHNSLPGNQVIDLVLSPEGQVIVLTESGAALFNHTTQQFTRLPPASQEWNCLVVFQGELWAGGKMGITKALAPNYATVPYPDGREIQINAMLPFGDTLLLGTAAGVRYWQAGNTSLGFAFSPEDGINKVSIMDIVPANIHGVKGHWVASRGDGFGWISIGDDIQAIYEARKPKAYSLLDDHVRSLAYDDQGSLWIGTYIGLNRLNLGGNQPSYYRSTFNEDLGDQVLELHATPDGRVLSYVRWRGLFLSSRIGMLEQKVDFPRNDFLRSKDLNFMFTDRQGVTWLLRGKDNPYQLLPDAKTPKQLTRPVDLTKYQIICMAQDIKEDDVYWLATDQGLVRFNQANGAIESWQPKAQFPQLKGDVITVVQPTAKGKIWLSAGNYYNDHLGYFDQATETFHFLPYAVG